MVARHPRCPHTIGPVGSDGRSATTPSRAPQTAQGSGFNVPRTRARLVRTRSRTASGADDEVGRDGGEIISLFVRRAARHALI